MPRSNALFKTAHAPIAAAPVVRKTAELERLIHEPVRLAIVSALAANESLTFSELKALLNLTDGNLGIHARKLEDAEYVTCKKGFEGRVPKSVYKLTARGRASFEKYLEHLEAIVTGVRDATAVKK